MQVTLATCAVPASRDTHIAPSQGDGSVLNLKWVDSRAGGWEVAITCAAFHPSGESIATPQTLRTKAEAVFW